MNQKRLKEFLIYDYNSGVFICCKNKNKWQVGDSVGTLDKNNGYVSMIFDGKKQYAHRLAWLYVYGYFPENDIDHINQLKDDNRIVNLREVSRQCNMRNYGNPRNNTSSIKGVSWNKRNKNWNAKIKINKKCYHLGAYTDFTNAVCARLAGEQAVNWAGCDNNSPAYQYVNMVLGSIS